MHRAILTALALSAAVLPNLAAAQGRAELDCVNGNAAMRIEVCSEVIARPGATGWDLFGAYHARGRARLETGSYGGAIEDFNAAMRYDPRSGSTYVLRGRAYAMLGRPEQAMADFTQAISFQPWLAEAYMARGLLQESYGQGDAAITDLRKALELDPALPSVREALRRLGAGR